MIRSKMEYWVNNAKREISILNGLKKAAAQMCGSLITVWTYKSESSD